VQVGIDVGYQQLEQHAAVLGRVVAPAAHLHRELLAHPVGGVEIPVEVELTPFGAGGQVAQPDPAAAVFEQDVLAGHHAAAEHRLDRRAQAIEQVEREPVTAQHLQLLQGQPPGDALAAEPGQQLLGVAVAATRP
jgi:hypothetical protein